MKQVIGSLDDARLEKRESCKGTLVGVVKKMVDIVDNHVEPVSYTHLTLPTSDLG